MGDRCPVAALRAVLFQMDMSLGDLRINPLWKVLCPVLASHKSSANTVYVTACGLKLFIISSCSLFKYVLIVLIIFCVAGILYNFCACYSESL